MPLQNFQYDRIMRQYNQKQLRNQRLREEHRQEAFVHAPRLRSIEEEIASASASAARNLLLGKAQNTEDLQQTLASLLTERKQVLLEHGYPENYLDMPYDCPICQDTGFHDGQKCICFKKAEIELLYAESNLTEILEKENFHHFSFDYYSDTMRDDTTGLSSKEAAKKAYDTALDFVNHFDQSHGNLFFMGDTGVGKSFLSHCIAYELLKSAHYVLYFSAFDLFDLLANRTFQHKDDGLTAELIYDCDLLIIDDLGTELTNSFISSQLFLCLNERIQRGKSTIISTNLSLQEFKDIYSERAFSRIVSDFQIVKLFGQDIRIHKKIAGGS
ncbi:MAG: ATP-binding protein [Eubacteriales bacterium]|nr:ATP-binding protein [Eubacteriales bacterium]